MEWTAFDQMAAALTWISAALWVGLLKQFGFWRWLRTLPVVARAYGRLLSYVSRVHL